MKGVLLIIAVLFIVLISGCTIPGSEEMRAMSLAAQTTEGQIMTKIYDASNRFQYCTTQGIIDAVALLSQAQQLTQEQLQQVYAQIEVMKKCIPRINIQAKNVADGIYNVEYTFVLPATCTNPQMRESFEMQDQPSLVIEANLNDNSTKVIKGKMTVDPAQIQTMFAQMESFGDCSLMFMTFAVFTSQTSQIVTREQPEIQTCSAAFILIRSGIYHSDTETLDLVVRNNGGIDLSGFTVLIAPSNGSVSTHSKDVTIAAGAEETLSITGISSDIERVDITSEDCQEARDMLLKYNIEGLD